MGFSSRTAQLLHEDHQATIIVIEALDQLIANARKQPPDTTDPTVQKTLQSASTAIEDEISNHFSFEEDELFTRLEEMGDVGIGEHLRYEHRALLPLGETVAKLAREALENGFSDQTWPPFRNAAAELIERMFAHIQKEEMALLPVLEDLLDPETDMELSSAYAATHGQETRPRMNKKPVDIQLTPLSPQDLEAVIAIDAATSVVSRRGYFEKRLAAAIECPRDYVFVGAYASGALAGFAFAKLVSGAFGQEGASASLDAIGVAPDHGLQGVGQKLLTEVEAVLRRKGVATLASQIDWSQQPMLGFLAHAGFALAPRLVLSRPTDEVRLDLEDVPDVEELDYSSPDSDAGNALSHDKVPVRSMKETDLGKIIAIDTANTGADRADYYTHKQHENLHQSGVQVSLVAEQDGFPVGFIMARVDFGEFGHTSAEAVMDSIGVDPGFQDKGIGQALMAKLMANLGILRVEAVRTEVDWNDTRLIDYFNAAGFTPAQRIALSKAL